jgi:hypothetical protein
MFQMKLLQMVVLTGCLYVVWAGYCKKKECREGYSCGNLHKMRCRPNAILKPNISSCGCCPGCVKQLSMIIVIIIIFSCYYFYK